MSKWRKVVMDDVEIWSDGHGTAWIEEGELVGGDKNGGGVAYFTMADLRMILGKELAAEVRKKKK